MTPLEAETRALAESFEGKREVGQNDGPWVRPLLAHVSLKPPAPYCAAAVSCIIYDAGMRVPVLPKFKRSAGALRLLGLNPGLVIDRAAAVELMRDGRPVVFVLDMGGGKGHAGFGVGLAENDQFVTLEGNTGPGPDVPARDREGQGFYRRTDRKLASVKGWLRVA
jgi:hypothetical protein